jgi:hypothetical protein
MMPKPMPPIKSSVAKQNPAIEQTQIPNEESAKLEAGRPSSMKEAAMQAVGKKAPPPPPQERPKSMREAVQKGMGKRAPKKGKDKK